MAVTEGWREVQVDGAVHRSWLLSRWPRRDVPAGWLDPLLAGLPAPRTVTAVFEPVAPSRSQRDLDREAVTRHTNLADRARRGFRIPAVARHAAHDVERREHELVAGYGELRLLRARHRHRPRPRRARGRRPPLRAGRRPRRRPAAPPRGPPRRRLGRRRSRSAAPWPRAGADEPGTGARRAGVGLRLAPSGHHRQPGVAVPVAHRPTARRRRGPYLGVDVTGGGTGWFYDPFELLRQARRRSPTPTCSSPAARHREVGRRQDVPVPRSRPLRAAPVHRRINDPKGEYRALGQRLGTARHQTPPRAGPNGSTRSTPAPGDRDDRRPARPPDPRHRHARRSSLSAASSRPRTPRRRGRSPTSTVTAAATLLDLADLVGHLPGTLLRAVARGDSPTSTWPARRRATAVRLALGKLLDRTLRGMFDGPTTVSRRLGPRRRRRDRPVGGVHTTATPCRSCMMAARRGCSPAMTGLAAPGPAGAPGRRRGVGRRSANERTARHLQARLKLCRHLRDLQHPRLPPALRPPRPSRRRHRRSQDRRRAAGRHPDPGLLPPSPRPGRRRPTTCSASPTTKPASSPGSPEGGRCGDVGRAGRHRPPRHLPPTNRP